jgi:hypothetical protein
MHVESSTSSKEKTQKVNVRCSSVAYDNTEESNESWSEIYERARLCDKNICEVEENVNMFVE